MKQVFRWNPLNNLITKTWKNWNSLRFHGILILKFYQIFYFHQVWYTKRKFEWSHDFFLQVFNVTIKPALLYEKLTFFAKLTEIHLRRSLRLIKLQTSRLDYYQKKNAAQVSFRKFFKVFKKTYFIKHL